MTAASSDESRLVYGSVNPAVFDSIPTAARSILDVGCGDGALGRALKGRAPCRVTGVTSSHEEVRLATAALDQVVCANLDADSVANLGAFDVIVCSHVLEHLQDPVRLLASLRANLTPDGLLVVALPNVLFWKQRLAFARGRFRYTEGGIMDSTHLRFFDWPGARELVERAGYRVLEAHADGGLPGSRRLGRRVGPMLDRIAIKRFPGLFGVQFVITARPLSGGD